MLLPMKYEFCPNNRKILSFHLSRLCQAAVSNIKVASWVTGNSVVILLQFKSTDSSYLG